MRKLMLGTVVLTMFSIFLLLVQLSCKDKEEDQTPKIAQQQNKILIRGGGLWIVNYDGTNAMQVPFTNLPKFTITLPRANNLVVEQNIWVDESISSDGQTIFIAGHDNISNPSKAMTLIYSLSPDGRNVKKVAEFEAGVISSLKPIITPMVSKQQNKILYSSLSDNRYPIDELRVWIANDDGTDTTRVPLTELWMNTEAKDKHSGYTWQGVSISPDGQTIFIFGYNASGNTSYLYSMSTDGKNVKKVFESPQDKGFIQKIQAF